MSDLSPCSGAAGIAGGATPADALYDFRLARAGLDVLGCAAPITGRGKTDAVMC